MVPSHAQRDHSVRFDWGVAGGAAVAEGADVVVVVDVLSFGTTLAVALEAGALVVPYPSGAAADELGSAARQRDAVLVHASLAPTGPAALLQGPVPPRLLLADGGSDVVVALADLATTVVGASLCNGAAVADWIAREHDAESAVVAVVAAGDRWPDGSLRPAVEDLWGAGAVLAGLEDHGWAGLSVEAAQACDAYRLVKGREAGHLAACAGGVELGAAGREADVVVAGEPGRVGVVPLLGDRGFVAAP